MQYEAEYYSKGFVNIMVDLRAKPYLLKDADIAWVESTFASMTAEEKVGQLFCS